MRLRIIASVVGHDRQARQEYLEAARAGALDVYGRRRLMSPIRELIPREDWFRVEWLELPDPLATGFHFAWQGPAWYEPEVRGDWYDREVRRDQIEALWLPLDGLSARTKRRAAIAAAIARGVRPDRGWKVIGGLIRDACRVSDQAKGFSDKAIERDFRTALEGREKEVKS